MTQCLALGSIGNGYGRSNQNMEKKSDASAGGKSIHAVNTFLFSLCHSLLRVLPRSSSFFWSATLVHVYYC